VGFVADVNASGVGADHFQAEVFALDLSHRLPSLLAVHLVPMVLHCAVACSFVFLLWLVFMLAFHVKFNLARPGWRNLSISSAGSGRSPFQDNARHHLHNRQSRSHALDRAGTLH
jgi:hypothetical protein